MDFGIEKCAMLVMKSGKRHLIGGMELQNQDKIRTLGERKPTDTRRYWKKLRKNISEESESYSRQNYIAETLSKE